MPRLSFDYLGKEQVINETQKETRSKVAMETCKDDVKTKSEGKAVDIGTVSCEDDDVEQLLISRLLEGHDKHVRPVHNRNDNVHVGFDVSYNQLVDLVRTFCENEANFIYTS
jgi:hypothetical protein